jgi:hypothetical protein
MIKSEILSLKDMNPAIQGMLLKLSTGQYLMKSNFTVSQVKWKERSKELNETTLHMMIDNIINYSKTVKEKYDRKYALHILNDQMQFNRSHIDKMVNSNLLADLMSEGHITIKALDKEMQKKTIDTLIMDAVATYKDKESSRWGRSGLHSHEALVPGLTMELYEYMLEQAEAAKKKFKDKKKAEEFHDGIIDGDIKGEILEHHDISFDILEKHGKMLMSELLLRLRTEQELSLENLTVGSYKEDYDSADDKVTAYITNIMEYNTCPQEYIAKIMASKEAGKKYKVQKQLLELEREDLTLLQLQLLLENPEQFKEFHNESYHGRQVFWTRFVQLLDGKPEFMTAMKSLMLDPATLDLPKPKGDFDD